MSLLSQFSAILKQNVHAKGFAVAFTVLQMLAKVIKLLTANQTRGRSQRLNELGIFLVGAFLGKSARHLQWLVFFSFFFVRLQSHSDWATFITIETTKTTSIRDQAGQRKLVQKGPPFHFLLF